MIKDYVVVFEQDPHKFRQEVLAKLRSGWELQGGVACGSKSLFQALVKRKETPDLSPSRNWEEEEKLPEPEPVCGEMKEREQELRNRFTGGVPDFS